jgi:DNA-binding GntR family transcriptional regulator
MSIAKEYGIALRPESVYEGIREAILSGRYAPGAPLREVALAEEFKTSRTPVKLALTRLTADGFAVTVPRAGVFVRKLDIAEMKGALEFRRMMEAGAAALAARKATPQQGEEVRMLAARIADASRRGRPVEMYELDVAFHRRVVALADNEEVTRVFENSQAMYLSLSLHDSIARPSARVPGADHADIAKAIVAADSVRAFDVMWNHFNKIVRSVERELAKPAPSDASRPARTRRRERRSPP